MKGKTAGVLAPADCLPAQIRRVGGDMDERAFAFLVGFGAGQEDAEPVRAEAEVGDPDRD
jgi:hypothetical protein